MDAERKTVYRKGGWEVVQVLPIATPCHYEITGDRVGVVATTPHYQWAWWIVHRLAEEDIAMVQATEEGA